MKDWAVAFCAAALLIGLVVWCASIFAQLVWSL